MRTRRPTITTPELADLCADLVPVRVLGGREGYHAEVSTPAGMRPLGDGGRRLLYSNLQEAADHLVACGILRFAVDMTGTLT